MYLLAQFDQFQNLKEIIMYSMVCVCTCMCVFVCVCVCVCVYMCVCMYVNVSVTQLCNVWGEDS